jgi:hypothetical protein
MPFEIKNFILRQERPRIVDLAYDKALQVIREAELNMDSFGGVYGTSVIQSDKARLVREKASHGQVEDQQPEVKMAMKRAKVLEAILHSSPLWFGPDAKMIRPSEFDDVVGGVDEVVEIKNQQNGQFHFLGLAIDATLQHELGIGHKFLRIKKEIEDGTGASLKYFRSESAGVKSGEKVPHVVIGVDKNTLDELADIWLDNRRRQELVLHPAQIQILREIQAQCVVFSKYAEKVRQTEIGQKYKEAGEIIEKILVDKGNQSRMSASDSVLRALAVELDAFKKTVGI